MIDKKAKSGIINLTVTASMVALSVVLCRFVGFSPEGTPFRFELGFLPIAIVAYLFGPFYSGLGYLTADVIGSLFSGYAPNPWLSFAQLLSGAIMGIFLHSKKPSVARSALCFGTIAVFIEVLIKSPVFVFMYDWTWGFTLSTRSINAIINLILRVTVYYLVMKGLHGNINRILSHGKHGKHMKNDFKTYANSFQAVTVPGLMRIGALCNKLGNPERKLKFIHIAGTNGKGSTSSNIASILEDAGYVTGKYISPNLIRVNERISINGTDISDEDLSRILGIIEPLTEEVKKETGIAPTQFEIWTAAAFLYFYEKKCDYVVLEVGLGGEFDATNIIGGNEIAIITRLGIDHTGYLGDTIEQIARAKAGIIKRNCTTRKVITVEQDESALEVIKRTASELLSSVTVAKPIPLGTEGAFERFSVDGTENLITGISGYHQIENAALAALAAKALGIDEKYIRSGIARAKNPARFEIIRTDPTVIYDGGHNENGIEALTSSIRRYYGDCKKVVIFACMRDKEIGESLRMLSEGDTEFIFTTVKDNPRASGASELKERAAALGYDGKCYDEIKDAYEDALGRGRLVIICGSLYLYRDFSEIINK